ncbi:hypothetical protein [Diaphorobacter sp.]|uniref:spermine/spermidine synthase domain-containing protein n=1 Tax=Diaphorobacter sp. TaxID=1934310 RepID=UPI0028B2476D|nr:hypothetical protein [Diaphorobacter sp.]
MSKINYPALLSFFCGFVSLSLEILWIRLYGFAHHSTPLAFGFVLGAYLVGIAVGAYLGGQDCKKRLGERELWDKVVRVLTLSAFVTLVIPLGYASLLRLYVASPLLDLLLIAICSGILAFIFPIAHHLGANENVENKGKKFALVYTANVLGASLGPLVTGYILLDRLTLQQCFFFLVAFQIVFAVFLLAEKGSSRYRLKILISNLIIAVLSLFAIFSFSPHLIIQNVSGIEKTPRNIIENRQGIISIYDDGTDDVVFGGNVYDGRTNLDVVRNSNGLHRPILLAALHPEPKRVLMIGLSIGTWLALVNGFAGVEHVDVVEINPGYLDAADAYPIQRNALRDPRVNVVIGDGRRWLRLNSKAKYDLIVMNTTWHWRSNSSLMLSSDFLNILKNHMNENSVLAFNATGSGDAFYTATTVFEHAYRYDNFIFASESDFRGLKDSVFAYQAVMNISVGGEKIFDEKPEVLKKFLARPFVTIASAQSAVNRSFEVVTDNNMITEFRYGKKLN